jgi:hypothetical protein
MGFRPFLAGLVLAAIAGTGSVLAQPEVQIPAWAPQPEKLTPFTAPNQLLHKLSDVLARHKGEKNWSQTMALTRDYIAEYIQMAPGAVLGR